MNVQSMVDLVAANVSLLDTYDLQKLYCSVISKKIKAEYNIYVDTTELDYQLSYEDNVEKFITENVSKKNMTIEEYHLKQKMVYSCSKIYSFDGKNTFKISNGCCGLDNGSFIYLLLYIVNNEVGEDLAKAQSIQKSSGLVYNETFDTVDILGLKVKRYQNGKLTIKRLSTEQCKELEYILALCKK
jgi:hypothetical protein